MPNRTLVCFLLLITQVIFVVAAVKTKSDILLICSLAITVLCYLYSNSGGGLLDILGALIRGGMMLLSGIIAFFSLLARAFWVEDRPNTVVWKVIFYCVTAILTISFIYQVLN